jgi:1,2-diacylglycerol 3-alpha-glucosyltransferase
MRIGIFTDTYTPFINGVTTSVLMLKKGLENKGHKVYVITVNPETMNFSLDSTGTVLRIPGIPIGIYDYRLTGIYPLKALRQIKKWHLDIIHSQTEFGLGTFARIVAKQLNIPLVHTYHTMYEDYVHYITHGYFDKTSKKIVEYLTLFYCDKTITELIVPTKKAWELFKEKYMVDRNVHIVPTGIDTERFKLENNKNFNKTEERKKLGFSDNDFIITFVGRIAEEKNIPFLLKNMKDIKKKAPNAKLLVIGDGPDLEKYKQYCIKHQLTENIIFAGKVPWDDIPKYYLMSDGFVTASQSETQGLTVIEAMAASLPVICISDESFTNTVIDNLNGLIFNNDKEYISSIIKLYNDKKLLQRLKKGASNTAEMHTVKYFAERVLDVYNVAIKNKPKSIIPLIDKLMKKRENQKNDIKT